MRCALSATHAGRGVTGHSGGLGLLAPEDATGVLAGADRPWHARPRVQPTRLAPAPPRPGGQPASRSRATGGWRPLTRRTQALEAVDPVHALPAVHAGVALAFVHLQLAVHAFETCTDGPHGGSEAARPASSRSRAQGCKDLHVLRLHDAEADSAAMDDRGCRARRGHSGTAVPLRRRKRPPPKALVRPGEPTKTAPAFSDESRLCCEDSVRLTGSPLRAPKD